MDFLELHKEGLETVGFWEECYKSSLILALEDRYKTEIIRDYQISDLIVKDNNKFLIKWDKRFQPLSDEELLEQYGHKK